MSAPQKSEQSVKTNLRSLIGVAWMSAVLLISAIFIVRTIDYFDGHILYTLNDDSMISMRYAHHLAKGYGFSFNIGDPPVEGFTNLLWMLYMTLMHIVFGSGTLPSLAVSVSAIFQLLIIGALASDIARSLDDKAARGSQYLSFLCAIQFGVLFWALRGMESGLVVLLTLFSVRELLRFHATSSIESIWMMAASNSLLILTRPDAALIVAITTLASWLLAYEKRHWEPAIVAVALPSAAQLAVTLFRLFVFGDLLPNTYYLKVVGVPTWDRVTNGANYLWQFSTVYLFLLSIVMAIALSANILALSHLVRRFIWFTITLSIALMGYSVYVGGDFAETAGGPNRFLLPCFPLLLISIWVSATSTAGAGRLVQATTIMLLLGLYAPDYWKWLGSNAPMSVSDNDRAKLGLIIKAALPEDRSVAGHAAGNTPYWSERRFIDLLGKNDEHIAKSPPARAFAPGHNKWDYVYSIGVLKPDLVIDPFRGTDFFGDLSGAIKATQAYTPIRAGLWVRNTSRGIDDKALRTFPPLASMSLD